MSAIGYIFARRIHMATQIPIGVIDASRGGTCIETWLPLALLKTIDTPEVKAALSDWDKKVAEYNPQKDLEARIKQFNDRTARLKAEGKEIPANRTTPSDLRPGPIMDMNKPGNCYASMIAPIAGFQIKGAFWHQKDNARLLQFIEAGALDPVRLEAILVRHRLADRWQRFHEQFLRDES